MWSIVPLQVDITAEPLDFPRCRARSHWRSVHPHFHNLDEMLLRQYFTRKAPDSSIMCQCRCPALWIFQNTGTKVVDTPPTLIVRMGNKCALSVSLGCRPIDWEWYNSAVDCQVCRTNHCWRSIDTHSNYIEIPCIHPMVVCNQSHTHYSQPTSRFWVLLFATRSFVTSDFVSNLYPRYPSAKWHGPISFMRFRRAIYRIYMVSLVPCEYSSTSSPFLIQLSLLEFHDQRYANSNIGTACTRWVQTVMRMDAFMNAAWWSAFRLICVGHRPHLQWLGRDHSLKFCLYISSLILLLAYHWTVMGT